MRVRIHLILFLKITDDFSIRRSKMSNRQFVSGDEAVSIGVKLARPKVVAAYPITPLIAFVCT